MTAADDDSDDSFGVIKYRIIGDDSAPAYFEINADSGEIRLKESVAQDTRTEYQVHCSYKYIIVAKNKIFDQQ